MCITEKVSIKIMKIGIIVLEIMIIFWDENIISKILVKVNRIKIIENLSIINVLSMIIMCFVLKINRIVIVMKDRNIMIIEILFMNNIKEIKGNIIFIRS